MQSTVIEVEALSGEQECEKPPTSNANLPYYNVKSVQFKTILHQFFSLDGPFINQECTAAKKEQFYENMENQKRKNCLRIEPTRA